jgi:hypothetical protein
VKFSPPLFFVGAGVALLGWAVVVTASRVEHERKKHHTADLKDRQPSPIGSMAHETWRRGNSIIETVNDGQKRQGSATLSV